MERLLKNPKPLYWMDRGDRCYAAVDNLHGGETYEGYVDGKRDVDGKDGYVFKYMSHDAPGIELTQDIAAENLFKSLDDVEAARRLDRSVQEDAVRRACATPQKLVAFLLSRAGLPEGERRMVLEQAYALGLAEPPEKDEAGQD